jgi:hypothetical protein
MIITLRNNTRLRIAERNSKLISLCVTTFPEFRGPRIPEVLPRAREGRNSENRWE